MTRFNTAIIGCGSIHGIHADAIAGSKHAKIAAVCDTDSGRAEQAAKRYSCKSYTDYRDMLLDDTIDVVHLCTPHYLHAQMAIDAMKSGKHVLTEKPMAISVEEATEMNRVSQQTGRTLGVCFQNRYNATSLKIREVLRSGKAGRILGARAILTWNRRGPYYTESPWRGSRETEGGGVLINQAIHTLDLMQWFMGEVEGLKAHVDTRLMADIIEVEDTADATITFRSGSNLLFYATNNYPADAPVELEIVCEKAKLKLAEKLEINWMDGVGETFEEMDVATGAKAYWGTGHKRLIADFYEKLQKKEHFALDGEEGIKTIRILQAIYRSSETGKYVELQKYHPRG